MCHILYRQFTISVMIGLCVFSGQQLAQQMQTMNPEFVESLRRHMTPPTSSHGEAGDAPRRPDQDEKKDEGPSN